jgi:hypothetical protein
MNVKDVVSSAIKTKGKNSISRKEVVRVMTSVVENPVSESVANKMIDEALEAKEIVMWRGRGGSIRNAGPRPEIAAYGSKSNKPRKPTKAQIQDQKVREAVAETEGVL